MICKYCGHDDGDRLLCGGVELPSWSPIVRSWVCDECEDRGQDWFHDADMEDC